MDEKYNSTQKANINTKKIFYDRIFPKKDGVDLEKLLIDDDAISYITIPRDSNIICNIVSSKIIEKYKIFPDDITIIDATACVGGDTISFCHKFHIVIPIEKCEIRYSLLENNLNVYGITNAYPVNGNCMTIIDEIQIPIDVIYIDPPWGGSGYKYMDNIEFTFDGHNLYDVVKKFLNKKIKLVVLKLPKNYAYDEFIKMLGSEYLATIHNEFKKINIVVCEKN